MASKTNRKFGRNLKKCAAYKSVKRREHNKLRKLRKHLIRQPQDMVAWFQLGKFAAFVGGKSLNSCLDFIHIHACSDAGARFDNGLDVGTKMRDK